jgi:hypothetical protein
MAYDKLNDRSGSWNAGFAAGEAGVIPANEAQTRELASLPEEQRDRKACADPRPDADPRY